MINNQKGIAPIIIVIVVVILLGVVGFGVYQTRQTNSSSQSVVDVSPSPIDSATPTPTPSIHPSPSPSSSSKATVSTPKPTLKPTSTPSPTPTIAPTPKPEISMVVNKDGPEYHFFASWKNLPSPTSGDWIGVYPFGENGDSPIDGKIYIASCADRGQTNLSESGPTMGSCPMYTKLDPGTYEVRLYSNDSNQRIATSGQFTTP